MATINCPHCNNQLNVPDNLNGMQVSCPICNQTFTAGQSAAASAPVFDTPADSGRFSVGNCNQLPLILGGLALLLAVIALVMQLMAPSVPYLKFKKDPEDAVKAYVKYNISRAQQSSYFWREHGGEIIDSLKISEVKTSGNFAAVFYTLSRGATTVKEVTFYERNADGYYISVSSSKLPKEWYNSISSQVYKFTKDSSTWSDFEK